MHILHRHSSNIKIVKEMLNAISNPLVRYIFTDYLGFPPAWNLALVQKT